MLCNAALNTYTAHGLYPSTGNQRGMLVNYDSLPGAVPKALLPLFGISQISPEWIAHMLRVSTKYSKARSTGSSFTGDSRQKNARATVEMRRYAAAIMQPTYASLLNYTKEALATVLSPEELELITRKHAVDTGGEDVMWSELSIIETPLGNEPLRAGNGNLRKRSAPDTVSIVRTGHRIDNLHGSESANSTIHALHSRKVGITREYYPWSPFSNTHDSQPFQVSNMCYIY